MGGDGGVIATKREFLRGAKKATTEGSQNSKNQEQLLRVSTCCLSGEMLCDPIVCCELGNLYNKDAVLQALIEKRLGQESLAHIRGLKDLKTLKFTPASSSDNAESDGDTAALRPLFVCPVTQVELNGLHPFFAIWSSGWVVSEKAIKELGMAALQDEYGPFEQIDLVKLAPLEVEVDALRAAMHVRRQKTKSSKKRTPEDPEAVDAKKKKKERKEDVSTEPPVGIGAPEAKKSFSTSSKVCDEAQQTFKSSEQSSAVFKKLFHKDGEKDKNDRDLFMAVAGLRYTLG